MINQWIGRLTTKRIVIYLITIAVVVYIAWYVVEALEGFNPDYRPPSDSGRYDTQDSPASKGSMEFDPTKKTPEAVPAK